MKRILLIFLFLPLFFSSCSKENISELYKAGVYEQVFEITSELCAEKFQEEALYYKAMSANRLGYREESVNAASLYILLYSKPSDEKLVMERIVLHYGASMIALEAAELLQEETIPTKEDSIQIYKVLNDNKLYTKANTFLNEIYTSLSTLEYVFCMINGGASVDRIISGIEELYAEEGVSDNLLSVLRLLLPKLVEDGNYSTIESFLVRTFNGDPDYGVIIGDFYYDIKNLDKMNYYWNFALSSYPEAIQTRLKIAGNL